jgi:hypothetical protein
MRGPPTALEPAHGSLLTEGSAKEEGLDTPTCRVTPTGLNIRLGVCKNCRKFYRSSEVREYNENTDQQTKKQTICKFLRNGVLS